MSGCAYIRDDLGCFSMSPDHVDCTRIYCIISYVCIAHTFAHRPVCAHTHAHMQRFCLVMSGCYSNGSYIYASDSRACIAIAIPYASVLAHTPRLSDQSSYRFGFRCFSYVRTRQEDHADVRPADTITVSQRALSCILQLSKCNDLPTTASRATIQRSRNAACLEAGPYGPLHQRVPVSLTNGKDYFVEIQHPFAMLHKLCATSSTFSAMLIRSLAAHPSTPTKPWRLIMYNDEVTPGPVFVY
jgi:hypothetical protein